MHLYTAAACILDASLPSFYLQDQLEAALRRAKAADTGAADLRRQKAQMLADMKMLEDLLADSDSERRWVAGIYWRLQQWPAGEKQREWDSYLFLITIDWQDVQLCEFGVHRRCNIVSNVGQVLVGLRLDGASSSGGILSPEQNTAWRAGAAGEYIGAVVFICWQAAMLSTCGSISVCPGDFGGSEN